MDYNYFSTNETPEQSAPPETIRRIVACLKVPNEALGRLPEPWNGLGQELCSLVMDQDIRWQHMEKAIIELAVTGQIENGGLPRVKSPNYNRHPLWRKVISLSRTASGIIPQLAYVDDVGEYIADIIGYAHQVSPMTPILFLESGALFLWSIGIARRLYYQCHGEIVYPNLNTTGSLERPFSERPLALNDPLELHEMLFHFCSHRRMQRQSHCSVTWRGSNRSNFNQLSPLNQSRWTEGRNFSAQKVIVRDEFAAYWRVLARTTTPD